MWEIWNYTLCIFTMYDGRVKFYIISVILFIRRSLSHDTLKTNPVVKWDNVPCPSHHWTRPCWVFSISIFSKWNHDDIEASIKYKSNKQHDSQWNGSKILYLFRVPVSYTTHLFQRQNHGTLHSAIVISINWMQFRNAVKSMRSLSHLSQVKPLHDN